MIFRTEAGRRDDRRRPYAVAALWTEYKRLHTLLVQVVGRDALVAVARKLAVIMHRMWLDGSEFRFAATDQPAGKGAIPRRRRPPAFDPSRKSPFDVGSFPLDGTGRFRGDVIDDAVNAPDLIDDARRDMTQEAHIEGVEICRHAISGGDGT